MCMGDIGTPSRILGPKFGAPFTYATFHHERALAPGQLSYQQMIEIYRHDAINRDTAIYGVIADPIGHSLSPQVHNAAFGEAGIDAVYVPFRVPFDALGQFMDDVPRLGLRGLSVTIPHKEAIAKFLTEGRSGRQRHRGRQHGAVQGGPGARLQHRLQGGHGLARRRVRRRSAPAPARSRTSACWCSARAAWRGRSCTACNAAVRRPRSPAAPARGPSTWPTSSAAGPSIGRPGTTPTSTSSSTARRSACIPTSMKRPSAESYLKPAMIVFDTVYNPESTLLLKEAKSHGCRVVTGVEMFIRQAGLQFMLFTGREAPYQLMRETLKRAIGPVRF